MPAALQQNLGTGRCKTAAARVFLRPGKGVITVNRRPMEQYFVTDSARTMVRQRCSKVPNAISGNSLATPCF